MPSRPAMPRDSARALRGLSQAQTILSPCRRKGRGSARGCRLLRRRLRAGGRRRTGTAAEGGAGHARQAPVPIPRSVQAPGIDRDGESPLRTGRSPARPGVDSDLSRWSPSPTRTPATSVHQRGPCSGSGRGPMPRPPCASGLSHRPRPRRRRRRLPRKTGLSVSVDAAEAYGHADGLSARTHSDGIATAVLCSPI